MKILAILGLTIVGTFGNSAFANCWCQQSGGTDSYSLFESSEHGLVSYIGTYPSAVECIMMKRAVCFDSSLNTEIKFNE